MSDLPETMWATPIDGELWQGTFTDSGKLNADAVQYTRTDTIPTWNTDMDAAAKDGSRVLIIIDGVDRTVLGQWNGEAWSTLDSNNWEGRCVTHWMPLPKPPEGGE